MLFFKSVIFSYFKAWINYLHRRRRKPFLVASFDAKAVPSWQVGQFRQDGGVAKVGVNVSEETFRMESQIIEAIEN